MQKNNSDSDEDDWGNINLAEKSSSSTGPLPGGHTIIRVKNDPDAVQKVKTRCLKGTADMHLAKIQIKNALRDAKGDEGALLKKKLEDVPTMLEDAINYWEDFNDWTFADLKSMKTKFKNDVDRVNGWLGILKAFQ